MQNMMIHPKMTILKKRPKKNINNNKIYSRCNCREFSFYTTKKLIPEKVSCDKCCENAKLVLLKIIDI